MPPSDLLPSPLLYQYPCREAQLRQLAALLSPSLPSPPTVVVYGARATGKSSVVKSVLESSQRQHAVVQCQETITGRHLFEQTVAVVHAALLANCPGSRCGEHPGRCENLSVLTIHLQKMLSSQLGFVLVLDGVDKQREAPPTLLPALARLGEFVPSLTVILIVQHAPPRFLHQAGIPHIHFSPYTRNQSIHIVSRHAPDIFLGPPADMDYADQTHEEDKAWLWPRFCAAVWDALAQNAARDLATFRETCQKLWRPFVAPIMRGDFGTRDFSRLLIAQRRLFQEDDALLESIVERVEGTSAVKSKDTTHRLPYYAKWLLIAAYLASYNPPRLDVLHFMKATEKKRQKKGGGTARSGGRPSQTRKIPRHLLAASAFTIDRLLSILHAILPDDFRTNIDIHRQVATLSSLRLLARAGGIGSTDPLEPGARWRVGPLVSLDHVQALSRDLDFNFIDYVAE